MTGHRLADIILVGIATLVGAALLGVFVYTEILYEPPTIDDQAELQSMREALQKQAVLPTYKLEKLIINLPTATARLRFLDTEIHLVSFNSQDHQLYEERKPQIHDLIISTAGQMQPEELNSISGKILLEDRIRRGINQIVGKVAVKEVLFARFVVQ